MAIRAPGLRRFLDEVVQDFNNGRGELWEEEPKDSSNLEIQEIKGVLLPPDR